MINSLKNNKIKELIKLREGKHRRRQQKFLLEGYREIRRASDSGFVLLDWFLCPDYVSQDHLSWLTGMGVTYIEVSAEVFGRIAVRDQSDGLLVVGQCQNHQLSSLRLSSSPLILALESLEKPGNLGAILRSADGAGIDAVVLIDSIVDIYNPQCLRSSLGAVFSTKTAHATATEFAEFCDRHQINLTAASPHGRSLYHQSDLTGSRAIILGSEANGLSSTWDKGCELVSIPMAGICDSLNVSVSAGVLIYEAIRQKYQPALIRGD